MRGVECHKVEKCPKIPTLGSQPDNKGRDRIIGSIETQLNSCEMNPEKNRLSHCN